MRTVIVHHHQLPALKDLLARIDARDVRVLVSGRSREEDAKIAALITPGTHVVLVAARRQVAGAGAIDFVVPNVADASNRLSQWLQPAQQTLAVAVSTPSVSLTQARERSRNLLFALGACTNADRLHSDRHRFVYDAARALVEYASNPRQPRIDVFFRGFGVEFATGGKVTASAIFVDGHTRTAPITTDWHLKEGDRTTADRAARIYFMNHKRGERRYVVILYCGPHPSSDIDSVVHLPTD